MAKIFHTDGSRLGFFTAVFDAYACKDAYLTSQNNFQCSLSDEWIEVPINEEKAKRVSEKLQALDARIFLEIDCLLRTCYPDREQIAFKYMKLIIKHGHRARENFSLEIVRKARDYISNVWNEVHRLHGFLRFKECENGVLYADCAPDNDVIELLSRHFKSRLKTQPFVIHDVKRNRAVLYDGKRDICVPVQKADVRITERERSVSALWKKYYHTVAIPMRKNTRQMKLYMPKRYWAFMCEKEGDDC
ncbi:MAG: TIGR03915 family putative DNA repair protein [Clostridia bacterium]|nr:TIGR03915 family putative DNA repair protein [Clostridia bacterium]